MRYFIQFFICLSVGVVLSALLRMTDIPEFICGYWVGFVVAITYVELSKYFDKHVSN